GADSLLLANAFLLLVAAPAVAPATPGHFFLLMCSHLALRRTPHRGRRCPVLIHPLQLVLISGPNRALAACGQFHRLGFLVPLRGRHLVARVVVSAVRLAVCACGRPSCPSLGFRYARPPWPARRLARQSRAPKTQHFAGQDGLASAVRSAC